MIIFTENETNNFIHSVKMTNTWKTIYNYDEIQKFSKL